MKILDLVNLHGNRLTDRSWLGRVCARKADDETCLVLSSGGRVTVRARGKTAVLEPGQSAVISPGGPESLSIADAGTNTFVGAIVFAVNPSDPLHAAARRFSMLPGPGPGEGAENVCLEINRLFMAGTMFSIQAARQKTAALVYALAAGLEEGPDKLSAGAHVEKALTLMHMNADGSLTLADLCAALNLSEAYFVRLFRQAMHLPPMKYYTRLKIHQAIPILMQGLSVKETAHLMGFSTESHFSKAFKQYMGVPPKNYKRNYLGSLPIRTGQSEKSIALVSAALSRYIDTVTDLVFIKDAAYIYRGCNAAFCDYVGKTKEQIFGHTDFTLFPRDIADFYRHRDRIIFEARRSFTNQEWVTYPDGRKALVEASKSPYFSEDGTILGIIGISRILSGRTTSAGVIDTCL